MVIFIVIVIGVNRPLLLSLCLNVLHENRLTMTNEYYELSATRHCCRLPIFPSSRYNTFYHISLLLCTRQQMFSTSPGHITLLSSVGWWKNILYFIHITAHVQEHPKFMSPAKTGTLFLCTRGIQCVRKSPLSLYLEN